MGMAMVMVMVMMAGVGMEMEMGMGIGIGIGVTVAMTMRRRIGIVIGLGDGDGVSIAMAKIMGIYVSICDDGGWNGFRHDVCGDDDVLMCFMMMQTLLLRAAKLEQGERNGAAQELQSIASSEGMEHPILHKSTIQLALRQALDDALV